MNTLGERLDSLINELHITAEKFAFQLGVDKGSISKWTKGKNSPDSNVLIKIVENFQNVNSTWLLTGKGPMFLSNEYKIPEAGNNTIEESLSSFNINQQHITDPMTIETLNKMLDIISRQQDDIHLAQINQANLIDKLPGGRTERKKAMGDN